MTVLEVFLLVSLSENVSHGQHDLIFQDGMAMLGELPDRFLAVGFLSEGTGS